jgi:hypothetical protein
MIPGTILTLDGVFSGAHRHAYMAFSISTPRIDTGFDINCLFARACISAISTAREQDENENDQKVTQLQAV